MLWKSSRDCCESFGPIRSSVRERSDERTASARNHWTQRRNRDGHRSPHGIENCLLRNADFSRGAGSTSVARRRHHEADPPDPADLPLGAPVPRGAGPGSAAPRPAVPARVRPRLPATVRRQPGGVLARGRGPARARARHRPADGQALHLRRQGPRHQGHHLFTAEGHRGRGVPGVSLHPRRQRAHRHTARALLQDRRGPRRQVGHPRVRRRASLHRRRTLRDAPAPPAARQRRRDGRRAGTPQVEGRRHRGLRSGQSAHHHGHGLEHPAHGEGPGGHGCRRRRQPGVDRADSLRRGGRRGHASGRGVRHTPRRQRGRERSSPTTGATPW